MRKAFTMIELIIIIVIIGVLAGLAYGKLSTVRDDAKITKDISNMATCINDASSIYTSRGVDIHAGDSENCDKVKCFTITYAHDGRDFKVQTNPTAESYCSRVDELGGHLAKTYTFRGSHLTF